MISLTRIEGKTRSRCLPDTEKQTRMYARILHPLILIVGLSLISSPQAFATSVGESSPITTPLQRMFEDKFNQKEETPLERLNRKALEAMSTQDWKKAFGHLMEAMKMDPNDSSTYVNFGIFHFMREEYPSSEKALLKALEVNPDDAAAHYQYSKVMVLKGDADLAMSAAKSAVEKSDPLNWKYVSWLGDMQIDRAEFSRAADCYDQALKILQEKLQTVHESIIREQSKDIIVEQWTDTEIVTEFGGNTREVEVQRYRTEKAEAPDEWIALEENLKKQIADITSRKDSALKQSRS